MTAYHTRGGGEISPSREREGHCCFPLPLSCTLSNSVPPMGPQHVLRHERTTKKKKKDIISPRERALRERANGKAETKKQTQFARPKLFCPVSLLLRLPSSPGGLMGLADKMGSFCIYFPPSLPMLRCLLRNNRLFV